MSKGSAAPCGKFESSRTKAAYRWARGLVGLMLVGAVIAGCSLVSLQQGQNKAEKIPSKPAASAKLDETVQKEAQAANDLANKVCGSGTTARSRDAKELVKTTDKVVTYIGKPAKPIDITKDGELAELHKLFEEEVAKHRADVKEWEGRIAELREDNAKLAEQVGTWKASFANLWFWFWVCIVVIFLLCCAFPTLTPFFIRRAKRGAEAAASLAADGAKILYRQATEIVHAIQDVRKDPKIPAKTRKLIDGILSDRQSGDTKVLIQQIKAGLGRK